MRYHVHAIVCAAAAVCVWPGERAKAVDLVGDPFITSYQNWVDPAPARGGVWRLNLHMPTLMETSDLVPTGNNPAAATNNGSFVPSLLIQDGFTSPATYDLSVRMRSNDDDGFGVVFGYQDLNNYFRVTSRAQANGNLGGTNGLSVQRVLGGVTSQLHPVGNVAGFNVDNSFALIDARAPYDLRVSVDGNNYSVFMAGINGGNAIWSGSDANLMPGKVGLHSWAQRNRGNANPFWGTEVDSVAVTSGDTVHYSGTFNTMPVKFRPLHMANSDGTRTNQTTSPIIGDDRGNFGLDVNSPWIYQQSNGFEWATQTKPNVDFIGPAMVVDELGSQAFKDYVLKLRLGARDDDGLGVLVRVQDDDNFYRIHFATQTITATNAWERAPRGLSVQKVLGGVWTEIFRDDQSNPLFVYANGPAANPDPSVGLNMFDLEVAAVGNTLDITVTDHLGNVIHYPLITDATDPILMGTVGLTTWGNEHVYFMSHGGQSGPLVTLIPEPGSVLMLALGLAAAGVRGRRR